MRLRRTREDTIDDLRAWLTTVTSRICLDALRSRRTRREVPVEIALGEPAYDVRHQVTGRPPSPEDELLLAESVGLALHVLMDSLTPAERVAFRSARHLRHPLSRRSQMSWDAHPAATKMLASRAPPARPRDRTGA